MPASSQQVLSQCSKKKKKIEGKMKRKTKIKKKKPKLKHRPVGCLAAG